MPSVWSPIGSGATSAEKIDWDEVEDFNGVPSASDFTEGIKILRDTSTGTLYVKDDSDNVIKIGASANVVKVPGDAALEDKDSTILFTAAAENITMPPVIDKRIFRMFNFAVNNITLSAVGSDKFMTEDAEDTQLELNIKYRELILIGDSGKWLVVTDGEGSASSDIVFNTVGIEATSDGQTTFSISSGELKPIKVGAEYYVQTGTGDIVNITLDSATQFSIKNNDYTVKSGEALFVLVKELA